MCHSRSRSSLLMKVKEGLLKEVSDEQVLDGQKREKEVCESRVACTKALGQAAWKWIFFEDFKDEQH